MRSNPMEAQKIRICGAKTKAGTPCKRRPTIQKRCHLHGGQSPLGMGHPNFKHGWYSKYWNREITIILLNNQGYYRNTWAAYLELLKELHRQREEDKRGSRESVAQHGT